MSDWNPDEFHVNTEALDVDASRSTDVACSAAIRSSMNEPKTHNNAPTHLLAGITTDNGGGPCQSCKSIRLCDEPLNGKKGSFD